MICVIEMRLSFSFLRKRVFMTKRSGVEKVNVKTASRSEIATLLAPILRFLRESGASREDVLRIVEGYFEQRVKHTKAARVRRVLLNNECARLISNWRVLPEFIDRTGYPRDLSIAGDRGFRSLAKISAARSRPAELLQVLQQYGAVAKTRGGKLRLLTKMFQCKTPSGRVVAFEPNAQFIIDASRVIEDQLEHGESGGRRRGLYWRAVDNHWIPVKHVRSFLEFSKRRTMLLMEEIEDWLDEHEARLSDGRTEDLHRLGVGAFAIVEPSMPNRFAGQR